MVFFRDRPVFPCTPCFPLSHFLKRFSNHRTTILLFILLILTPTISVHEAVWLFSNPSISFCRISGFVSAIDWASFSLPSPWIPIVASPTDLLSGLSISDRGADRSRIPWSAFPDQCCLPARFDPSHYGDQVLSLAPGDLS